MRQRIFATGVALAALTGTLHAQSAATGIDISQQPLFTVSAEPPLNMLVMGRDHKLYYEAYNDASDLDGDRVIDIGYKPDIEYFGYFDSHRCYAYTGDRFVPTGVSASKRCRGPWSGDFLNYVTTSRMDAIRKVLYGGYRAIDDTSETVLERSHIPQDAHSWAKQYVSPEVDGYDIGDYTPLSMPASGLRHLFTNVTIRNDEAWGPRLRVLTDTIYPPWQWVSIERAVAGDRCVNGSNGPRCDATAGAKLTDFKVRVRVCDADGPEAFCKRYPNGKYKPVGLLHDYGESGQMMFGLLTGSYAKNTEGGTLRSNMARFDREVDADTGVFRTDVKDGIVYTIDHLRTIDFNPWDFTYSCGWITTRPVSDGECSMWGNPVAEMMYESLRYFGGAKKPRPEFDIPGSASDGKAPLSLAKPDWKPPYVARPQGGGFAQCAAPVMTVVSDINPSYDFSLPGSAWRSLGGGDDPPS
ncbi:MAG TPA: fimbrial protein, partial [Tahibacter sp.]|nr:fimbrial protein [Tahibacter sp.]